MTPAKTTKRRKRFDQLRKQIDADPARRAKVEKHKAAMLGEVRRQLDLTQAAVADRLEVTQENVSQIERGEADVRLSTLSRYVEALGGRLEIRAAFPGRPSHSAWGRPRRCAVSGPGGYPPLPPRGLTTPRPQGQRFQPQQATPDPRRAPLFRRRPMLRAERSHGAAAQSPAAPPMSLRTRPQSDRPARGPILGGSKAERCRSADDAAHQALRHCTGIS